MDQLRVARAPRRARRDGCRRRAHRDRPASRQRLVARLARLHRAARGLRRRAGRLRRARGRVRGRARADGRHRRDRGARHPARCSPTTSTTARRSTRACATPRGSIRDSTMRAGMPSTPSTSTPRASSPTRVTTGPPAGRVRGASASGPRPSGKTLVDFGQNLVGFVRVRVAGPAGTEVVLRHAEVLEHGELGTRPLRRAEATDRFILSGGDDVFEPTLTFHGFRYAEVTGWPGEFDPAALTAVVVGTDIRPIGSFECSDPSSTSCTATSSGACAATSSSVPTDCPQRDERLGWTGDLAVFAPTAAFLGDVESFLADWLVDVELERRAHAEQTRAGRRAERHEVPRHRLSRAGRAPRSGATRRSGCRGRSGRRTAHEQTLRDAYPLDDCAHAHRSPRRSRRRGLWDTGFQFGDWLDPDAPADDPGKSKAPSGRRRDRERVPHARRSWSQAAEVLGRARRMPRSSRAARSHRRGVPRALRARRPRRERQRDRLRARDRLRSARRMPIGRRPATASPSWCAPPVTASARGSPARRS